jgi:superfamily I DNA/RNA helicase
VTVAADGLVAAVESEVAALMGDWVSVAVIGPEALLSSLESVLAHGDGVSLLDPLGAKGLEFDAVVVVEPAAIYREVNGARLLYVAMTRAVQELSLVHAEPLPGVLVA